MNPYKKSLDTFFETITDFKHTLNRINEVLLKDVQKYSDEEAIFISASSLIISDWTGSTDNDWKINFHTGNNKLILKENYANEMENILSREFGFAFSQCYEAFETFLKNIIDIKIKNDQIFRSKLSIDKNYSRDDLKGGEYIFKLLKKAGGNRFKRYSKQNNNNFRFRETFKIFSEIRHAITHSKGNLKTSKIPKDKYYRTLFEYLLPLNNLEDELIILKFDYKILDNLLIYLAEFGYQIYKVLSEEENFQWRI